MKNAKIAFVSDFDGTITDDDFFEYTTKTYFDEEALKPWREYVNGTKNHFDALKEMFAKIRVQERDLNELIETINVDKDFEKVIKLCFSKNITLYICSAGNDYYIQKIIGNIISEHKVKLVTNHGEYSPEEGLVMTSPEKNFPFYDEKIGISKYKLVKQLKDEGYFVVFAGDGPPDVEPARIADVVFAKKILLKRCLEENIPFQKFDSFANIYEYFKEINS
ncbi:MAG: MtnX-like HAD-IB family phosphatase [Alphaproteobacteria bacterium]